MNSNPIPIIQHISNRAVNKYKQEGIADTLRAVTTFAVEFFSDGIGFYSYQSDRVDLDQRWELLEPHLNPEYDNLLDIGCAEGDTVRRAAERGLLSVGIDQNGHRIAVARSRNDTGSRSVFIHATLGPKEVGQLPKFDVVCLLTVYHYFGMEYGWETAESMLRNIGRNTEKILFEVPGPWDEMHPFDLQKSEEVDQYVSYLESVFNGSVSVEFIGRTEFMTDKGPNLIFVIECQEWPPRPRSMSEPAKVEPQHASDLSAHDPETVSVHGR